MDAANPKPEAGDEAEAVAYSQFSLAESHRSKRAAPGRQVREARWLEENAKAIEDYGRWFDAEGYKYMRRPTF